MRKLLSAIYVSSLNSKAVYQGEQDYLKRYIYCAIEKIRKISHGMILIYHLADEEPDVEYSFGILLRSLVMDMAIHLEAKSIIGSDGEKDIDSIKEQLRLFSMKVLNDGPAYLFTEIKRYQNYNDSEKNVAIEKITRGFQELYSFTGSDTKLLKGNRINISEILNNNKR
jgi:hypothetical protein